MRWTFSLPLIALNPGEEIDLGPDDAGRTARIAVRLRDAELEIDAAAFGRLDVAAPPFAEWYLRRHFIVLINPRHDHATTWSYALTDGGEIVHVSTYSVIGEEPANVLSAAAPPGPTAAGQMHLDSAGGFRAILHLPADAIWPDGKPVAGIAFTVGFHAEIVPAPLCWPAESRSGGAMNFADLYREPSRLHVTQISIPEPAWGLPARLMLQARVLHSSDERESAPKADAAPSASADEFAALPPRSILMGKLSAACLLPGNVTIPQPGGDIRAGDASNDVPRASSATPPAEWQLEAVLPVTFPHQAKWANDMRHVARLQLQWCDAAGRLLWSAEYPFAIDAGIIVRERYGRARLHDRELPRRPEPGDADFIASFRDYLLSHLSDYQRLTTTQAAPSDFFLRDTAGKADVNLADDDWPRQVARILADRFDRWDDALCAATLWVHHPAVTRHSASWSRISGQVTTASIPRVNGCFCDDTSRLTAMLAEEIGREMSVPIRGFSMGLRGHLTTLLETPAGRIVLDGMIGLFFHTLDNQRLATLEEMRTDRRIVERTWHWPRAHGHEFFLGNQTQIIRPPSPGRLVWPAQPRNDQARSG